MSAPVPDSMTNDSRQDPVLAAVERLERRLIELEATVARVAAPVARADLAAATAVDTFDDVERMLRERGVDLDARLRTALRVLEQLSERSNTDAMLSLLALVQQAPQALAVVTDVLDHRLLRAADAGVDLSERAGALLDVAERLTRPEALGLAATLVGHVPSLERLLDSGILSPGAVSAVSRAGEALAAAGTVEAQPVGLLGLLRALREPDMQRALGFALQFARCLGRALEPSAAPALPSTIARRTQESHG